MIKDHMLQALPKQKSPRLFSLNSLKIFSVLSITVGCIASIVLLILGLTKPSGAWIAGVCTAAAYLLASARKPWREGNKRLAVGIGGAGAIAMGFVLLCVALIKHDMLNLRFGYTEAVISIMIGVAAAAIFERTEGASFNPRPQGVDDERAPPE